MRLDHTRRRPWRRRRAVPAPSVFEELARRELHDLETCRKVWEHEADPVAVCEAVRQSNLPEWLTSAVLVLITDGETGYPALRSRMWRSRTHDAVAAHRAACVALARDATQLELTWHEAYVLGQLAAHRASPEARLVGAAGSKRTYDSVRRSLRSHPWRYHRPRAGLGERIDQAWAYMLGLMKAAAGARK